MHAPHASASIAPASLVPSGRTSRQSARTRRYPERAWKVLVKELGIVDATRFVMAVEPGEGDSVEKYAQLWGGMTLEAVHDEILKASERGELAP
jgi:hypothetical protein